MGLTQSTLSVLKNGASGVIDAVRRLDGYLNFATGLGTSRDKTTLDDVGYDVLLSPWTLENIFSADDIARRIVSTLPQEAFKLGFALSNNDSDPDEAQDEAADLLAECDRLRVQESFVEAITWGRLYGFGAIVIGAEGAGMPDEPLDDERVTGIKYLLVLDKRDMVPQSYYDDAVNDEKFGEVKTYMITPTGSPTAGAQAGVTVHESRVIAFGGAMTSRRERMRNNMADHSVLQACYRVLMQANRNWAGVCHLMSDVSQGVFKIRGLMDMVASGQASTMQQRMEVVDMGRSVARSIILDADGESFERVATPMGGIPEVLEKTWQRLAAAADMPLTVLMGVSPAGLNATGESDIKLWYDRIQRLRQHIVQPKLERIVRLIAQVEGHATPDAWHVCWPSLWQMSATERADYRQKIAAADKTYIDAGVLLPEEVALSRFGTASEFNGDATNIDIDARKAALEAALDEIKNPPEPPPPPPAMPPAPGAALGLNGAPEQPALPEAP